jgi:6-phosphofructokinase 1
MIMAQPTILVVDHDPIFRAAVATDILEPQGYRVLQAGTPEEAHDLLAQKLVHIVLAGARLRDAHDPADHSGWDFCRDLDPRIARVLLTTGLHDGALLSDAVTATAQGTRLADRVVASSLGAQEQGEAIRQAVAQVLTERFEVVPARRIAVLTSGGDAPGMNAAIWAVVRTALAHDVEVIGVRHGYRGLVEGDMDTLSWAAVGDIMAQGGTVLGTARYPQFRHAAVRERALAHLARAQITGLIVVGGDGSLHGARQLAADCAAQGRPLQMVAIPGTIDNDLWGTDHSLGAASTVAATIDALRQMVPPAQALRRIFVVEVMGRYCGYLAVQAALGSGADAVILPEQVLAVAPGAGPWTERLLLADTEANLAARLEEVTALLEAAFAAGQRHGFVIVGEGAGSLAQDLAARQGAPHSALGSASIQEVLERAVARWPAAYRPDVRSQALGYPVRGVAPAPFDTWLGARLGVAAVRCLLRGETNVMVGCSASGDVITPAVDEVVERGQRAPQQRWAEQPAWQELLALHELVSRPPTLRDHPTRGNDGSLIPPPAPARGTASRSVTWSSASMILG